MIRHTYVPWPVWGPATEQLWASVSQVSELRLDPETHQTPVLIHKYEMYIHGVEKEYNTVYTYVALPNFCIFKVTYISLIHENYALYSNSQKADLQKIVLKIWCDFCLHTFFFQHLVCICNLSLGG